MDERDRRVPIEATGIYQMLRKMKKEIDYIIKKETERRKGGEGGHVGINGVHHWTQRVWLPYMTFIFDVNETIPLIIVISRIMKHFFLNC